MLPTAQQTGAQLGSRALGGAGLVPTLGGDQRLLGGIHAPRTLGQAHDEQPQPARRRRRELLTTMRLEAAMAAPAIMGLSRPATARGIAATL